MAPSGPAHLWVAPLLLGLSLSPDRAGAASPWTPEAGHFTVRLWDRSQVGHQLWLSDGRTAELPGTYRDHSIRYEFELGLSNELSLVIRGNPVGLASFDTRDLLYTGPVLAGLSQSLLRGPLSMSVEVDYGLSIGRGLGADSLASGIVKGEHFDADPIFATQIFGGEFSAALELPFGFAAANAGVRLFTDRLAPYLYTALSLAAANRYGSGDVHLNLHLPTSQPIREINLFGLGQSEVLSVGASLSYWLVEFLALEVGLDSVPWARGIGAAPIFSAGLRLKN